MALTKKQFDVIDEWFKNGGDEAAVLQKYNVSQKKWRRWLADESFEATVADKIKASQRQSRILIAQYTPMAAAKLVHLCGSDKEEISRKACLDILALQAGSAGSSQAGGNSQSAEPDGNEEENMLDSETAAKILAVLAGNPPEADGAIEN